MNKKAFLFVIFLVSRTWADQPVTFEDLPSSSFRRAYVAQGANLSDVLTDAQKRSELMQAAVLHAGKRQAAIENRPYLFSLVVDLYKTLAPGEASCGLEGEVAKCSRESIWYEFERLTEFTPEPVPYARTVTQEMQHLASLRNGPGPDLIYSRWYLWKNIKLEPKNAAPSLSIHDLDVLNPSEYPAFKAWMSKMATAMAQGISPDKAEEWTAAHKHEFTTMPAASTTAASATLPAAQPSEQQSQPVQSEGGQQPSGDNTATPQLAEVPASGTPWGVVVFLLAAVVVGVILRRRKPSANS